MATNKNKGRDIGCPVAASEHATILQGVIGVSNVRHVTMGQAAAVFATGGLGREREVRYLPLGGLVLGCVKASSALIGRSAALGEKLLWPWQCRLSQLHP